MRIVLFILLITAFFGCSGDKEPKYDPTQKSLKRGKLLYHQCIVCHGDRAQNSYMEVVPPIRELEFGARSQMMEAYRNSSVGKGLYGLADLKGEVMLRLSDEDMRDIDIYIEFMKEQDEKNSN